MPDNEQALCVLKKQGPQPLATIAKEIGVTTEGARFHLLKLEKEGLVESRSEARGRGRPKKIWSLTDAGNARFPDRHAELTFNLISIMREVLGEEAVQKVIRSHRNRVLSRYSEELKKHTDLESRIAKLAEIRNREGSAGHYL